MPEIDRRDFLKLVGASTAGAAATACSDIPQKLVPYVVQPEEITPGNAVHYASTCTECRVGCGLHVRTREGRPIKLEGNPDHPINRGALCSRAQAGLGRAYSPDRIRGPRRRTADGAYEDVSWDEALASVADAIRKAPGGTWVLGGDPGATAGALLDRFVQAAGLGGRIAYEPLAATALREAARQVFGVASEPIFDVSQADVILDFGAEMLDGGPSPVEHQRQWAEARDLSAHEHGGARLVYVGSRLSLTASSSDEWLPAKPGTEGVLALALAKVVAQNGGAGRGLLGNVLAGVSVSDAASTCDLPAESIERLGRALASAKGAVALPPAPAVSSRRAVGTNAAVLLLNHVIGAVGTRVIVPAAGDAPTSSYGDVLALIQNMASGKVGVLLVHHANPAYSLPKAAGFADAVGKVGLVVSFASMADETSQVADLILPDHAPAESWGDVANRPGVRSIVQPTLRPLFDTRAFGDTLLDLGRAIGEDVGARLPTGTFKAVLEEAWSDTDLRAALKAGGVFSAGAAASASGLASGATRIEAMAPKFTGDGEFTLVTFAHSLLGDGSGANLPWLQEIPDPVTSVAWDSWAEISLATAQKLGVEAGDLITITTSAGSIDVPAYPRGGIRDDVVAVPIGQGHTVGTFASKAGQGLPGVARGVNVSDALPAAVDESGGRAWLTERASLASTGRHRRLPVLQTHDNQRGRGLAKKVTLASLLADAEAHDAGHAAPAADAHGGGHGDAHGEDHGGGHGSHEILEEYDPAADAADEALARNFSEMKSVKASPYRWGLTIDVDKCTGCSACIAACYVENNIPVVGEDETRRVRQMAWLRINRFIGDGEPDLETGRSFLDESREKLGEVDVRNAPMLCQQCGSAPCEPVCPVIATYHNEEGLNAMIYNRCIGTRYCANNCPYKVRRFNYFDHQIERWPEPMELGLNPDVTVRGQGVMEKCNFCVQRIQVARQNAKHEGRLIADGEVKTACQQTCPSDAISFGNLRDTGSEVSKRAAGERGYHALHVLNTRPAITYLAKVERGPVEG